MTTWHDVTHLPSDGDSVWLVIREWDGINHHVDYAITFVDVDGLIVHRYESNDFQQWPPRDVVAWSECDVPSVPELAMKPGTPPEH